jgi:hypothetical protein
MIGEPRQGQKDVFFLKNENQVTSSTDKMRTQDIDAVQMTCIHDSGWSSGIRCETLILKKQELYLSSNCIFRLGKREGKRPLSEARDSKPMDDDIMVAAPFLKNPESESLGAIKLSVEKEKTKERWRACV